jgi:phosphoribosylglycinamide formyltransferase-1
MGFLKIAVLISGRGSNLQALINSSKKVDASFKVVQVISNKHDALGLELSKKAGIQTAVIDNLEFKDRKSFDIRITEIIKSSGAELVCLAGFMRILSASFIDHWLNRLINIHPSRLPDFKGLNVHQRVIESGKKITGCTVHYVRNEIDTGPIICQDTITVNSNDNAETLAARVLEKEHLIYPQAIKLIAQGRVTLLGEQVFIDGKIIYPN